MHSVAASAEALRRMLIRFTPVASRSASPDPLATLVATTKQEPRQPGDPLHPLPNRDLDTGRVVQPGGYSLTDSTYAQLLHTLTQKPDQPIPPGLKQDIQAYYANLSLPITTKKDPARWAQVLADLAKLAAMPTSSEPQPYPTYGDDADKSQ